MKIKYTYKLFITLFITVSFLFGSIGSFPAIAEGDSYLDTIYRAVDGDNDGTYSDEDILALEENKACETSTETCTGIVINTDDPNPTVTIEDPKEDGKKDNEEPLSHVNSVLADMTRILVNMNTGLTINTSSFTVIDLSDDGGTDTGSTSSTCTSTCTGSTTSTCTSTCTGSTTSTCTSTCTGSTSDTSTNTDTGSSSDTSSNTDTGSKTDTGTNTNPFGDDTTVTGSDTGTVSGSETRTNTATDTRTDAEKIEDAKAKIQSTYGIKCTDSTSNFSLRQLELINEALEKLDNGNSSTKSFLRATTEYIREKVVPDNFTSATVEDGQKDTVMGYVIRGETAVHLMDYATVLSESDIKKIEEINNRKFTKSELVKLIEEEFTHTVVHEMTHAFQNSEKAKGNDLIAKWQEKFWNNDKEVKTDGIPPTSYAKTAPYEDMAECVSFYVTGNGILTKNKDGVDVYKCKDFSGTTMDMERYNFIKDNIFNGMEFLDSVPESGGLSI